MGIASQRTNIGREEARLCNRDKRNFSWCSVGALAIVFRLNKSGGAGEAPLSEISTIKLNTRLSQFILLVQLKEQHKRSNTNMNSSVTSELEHFVYHDVPDVGGAKAYFRDCAKGERGTPAIELAVRVDLIATDHASRHH